MLPISKLALGKVGACKLSEVAPLLDFSQCKDSWHDGSSVWNGCPTEWVSTVIWPI